MRRTIVLGLLICAGAAVKAGKSADDATASFDISKYPGYDGQRLKVAVQAIYDELKQP
jgi:hypothetical protein